MDIEQEDFDTQRDPLPNMSDTGDLGEIELDPSWSKPPSLSALVGDLEESKPYHDKQVQKIEGWLEYLNPQRLKKDPKRKNRSRIQPKLIRKQAEWRYSSLTEPFLNTNKLFDIKPVTAEDKPAADQNKLLLNHQFNHKINKIKFIDEWVRQAVNTGTAITRIGWHVEEETEEFEVPIFEFTPNPDFGDVVAEALALKASNPRAYDETVPEGIKQAVAISEETGVPHDFVDTGEVKTETRLKMVQNHPTLEVCDFRNVHIDPTCNGDVDAAKFIVYSFESSHADLLADGRYKNLKRINKNNNTILSEPDHSLEESTADFNFKDNPRKKFIVYEYWGFMNVTDDPDAALTPIVAAWVGNTIIRLEENPFPDKKLPFDLVSYMPKEKDVYGEPDSSLLEDNQDILGAVLRGLIDSMARSANAQTGVAKGFFDPINRRKFEEGNNYEYNPVQGGPAVAVKEHTYPDMPVMAQWMMEYQGNDAEGLTGVKSFTGGLSGDALGSTATGVRGVLDSASKRELAILRRLAQSMIRIGNKIASMNAVFLSEKEVIRVTNDEYVTIARDELAGDYDIELSISTAEEENAQAEEITFMLQTLGNTVDFGIMKKLLVQLFKLRKMPHLAEEMANYEPQPDPAEVRIKELEAQKLQAEIAEIMSKVRENESQAALNLAKADNEALGFVETESGVRQVRDLEKQQAQAVGNIALEREKQKNKISTSTNK